VVLTTGLVSPFTIFLTFYRTRRYSTVFTKSPQWVPMQSQVKEVHTLTRPSFNTHFNIIISSVPTFPNRYLAESSPSTILKAVRIVHMHTTCSVHLILLVGHFGIIWRSSLPFITKVNEIMYSWIYARFETRRRFSTIGVYFRTAFLVVLLLPLGLVFIYCRYNPVVEVEINLRPTVSRPVCLGFRHPSRTRDQFFFLLEISFRPLWVCYIVAPSLTRGRVCNLL
jgi:hypothetical protein